MAENGQEKLNGDSQTAASTQDMPASPAESAGVRGRIAAITGDVATPGTAALFLQEVLEGEGYEIFWASPRELLYGKDEIVGDADVVVLDATTTDVNALCERLKFAPEDDTSEALGTAPILALTAETPDFPALLTSGIDDFIQQGVAPAEIKARLALAVRLGRAERELRTTREELSHQIQVDDLTGTLNRRFFFQAAYRECSRAQRYGQALSCLMVDLDHFHLYNTTFGYGCGDYILREVATILRHSVRDTDLVARFGGSKFVVLLTHTNTEGAMTVRQKIENWVKGGYFVWQHQRLPVTVSIGEAERVPGRSQTFDGGNGEESNLPPSTREELAELLEDADSALYVSKKGARFPTFIEAQPEQPV